MKVKGATTWESIRDVHAHDGSAWQRTKRVLVHDGSAWQEAHRSVCYYTIASTTHQVSLDSITGVDPFNDVVITIDPGVVVYSNDTAVPAFITGTGINGTLTIINNGTIYGAGGDGGAGGLHQADGQPGHCLLYTSDAADEL